MKRIVVGFSFAGAFLSLLAIWLPVWSHFHVRVADLSEATVESLSQAPDGHVLHELSRMETTFALDLTEIEAVRMADQLLAGVFEVPGIGTTGISIPFDGRDYESIPESFQLRFASLYAPLVLILAYEQSGENSYYELSRDMLLGWAKHDRSSLLPKGLQWNDHAIASTAYVLTRFWTIYRDRADFDPGVARQILRAAGRTAEFLAKDGHYTAATNHGIMQNLALLHLATAFPAFERSSYYQELAVSRLSNQMQYYLSEEGAILEHSPGYHQYGLNLLADYARYRTLIDRPVSDNWSLKYRRALSFYSSLRRDDSSLPKIGDTLGPANPIRVVSLDLDRNAPPPYKWEPDPNGIGAVLLPMSGYAIWWDEASGSTPDPVPNRSQMTMSWSRFPSLAHKHADDLGLTLWRTDGDWITSSGYWPYWSQLRNDALAWPASNALHFSDETLASPSESVLLGHTYSPNLALLDVERKIGNKKSVRRQVLRQSDGSYLIIDSVNGGSEPDQSTLELVWTGAPDLDLGGTSVDNEFTFLRRSASTSMHLIVASDELLELRSYRGNENPFRGWTYTSEKLTPAPAIEVSVNRASWIASYFTFVGTQAPATPSRFEMLAWESPDRWTVRLTSRDGVQEIARDLSSLIVTDQDAEAAPASFVIARPEKTGAKRSQIVTAYTHSMSDYPQFKPLLTYRVRASGFIGILLIFQEAFFLVIARFFARHLIFGRVVSIGCWIGISTWLLTVYLV